MVKVREDMTGWIMSEHGVPDSKLTVLYQVDDYITPQGKHRAKWMCQCSCGSQPKEIIGADIKNGTTISCGCYNKQRTHITNHKENPIRYNGDICIGTTLNTNVEFYFDKEDEDKVKKITWFEDITPNGYHRIRGRNPETNKLIILAQYLTGYELCEHKDRNPFNNCRNNIRPATHSQNAQNTSERKNNKSGFTGVRYDSRINKYIAEITRNYKHYWLGSFDTIQEAIKARIDGEQKYHDPQFASHREEFYVNEKLK